MDGVVYIDQSAVFGVSLAMRRHHHRGLIKLEKSSFFARRQASLQRLDASVDDKSRFSKKPIKREMRIGSNGLC
jgi:hypothetical protein